MVKIDIISDPVCPWCYIGKANLDRALADHPDHPFAVQWHPFQLNPDMPEGADKRAYLEAKFGGPPASTLNDRIAKSPAPLALASTPTASPGCRIR